MDGHDETIVPKYYPIAVRLLEQRKNEIMDCMNRMLSNPSSYEMSKNASEYIMLMEQLKLTKREIWYLKNI